MNVGLPHGWEKATLTDIGQWGSGGTPTAGSHEYYGGDIPWAVIGDLNDGVVETTAKSITQLGLDNSSAKIVHEGTLLVAMYGSIGKLGVTGMSMSMNQAIAFCNTNDACELDYLFNWLRHARPKLVAEGKGGAQQNISQTVLKAFPILVPPLNEQKRIVAKIEELTTRSRRAKEALDAVPPLLDKLRQSILAAAFRGDLTADWRAKNPNVEPADQLLARIRTERRALWESAELAKMQAKGKVPRDDQWKEKYVEPTGVDESSLPDLPDGWCWATAEQLADAARPIMYGIVKAGPHYSGGIPYVRVTEVAAGRIVLQDLPRCDPERAAKFSRTTLAAGDFLVSKDGTIGKVAFVPDELVGGNINQHVMRVAALPLVNRHYFAHAIEAPQCQRWMTGEVRGIALQGVNVEDFRRMPLPLAPAEEQSQIVTAITQALSRVRDVNDAIGSVLVNVTDVDGSILAKAFRGELVPQDPTDEPASVLLDRIRSSRQTAPATPKPRRARTPKAPAEAPAASDPPPAQLALELTPVDLQSQVFDALWLRGPLDKNTAVRTLAEHLRERGAVEFKRLRSDGPLYTQLLAAIESAVKSGELDRPHRGQVRAVKRDATEYTADDWRSVLVASLGPEPIHQEDAVRQAAEWARDNLGLTFSRLRSDGHIANGLRSAIRSAIRRGLIAREGRRIMLVRGRGG